MGVLVGLDIGGTKCAVVCAKKTDGKPKILGKVRFATAECGTWQKVLSRFCESTDALLAELGETADGIGISCGGPLDSRKGLILSPPNLPGWDNVPIVSFFRERYGVPVFLQNDANACAVAEWKFGAGTGCRNMVFLTFGTGLGAGLILDGRLYSGTNDMAGEVGHIRIAPDGPVGYGKRGSFEGFCSGGGIARLAAELYPKFIADGGTTTLSPDKMTAADIAAAADAGDAFAQSVYTLCGEKLGLGLSVLLDILNPERIVIGSIFARSGHLLSAAMQRVIQEEALPHTAAVCAVVPAALGEKIGDYAALGVLVSGMEENG